MKVRFIDKRHGTDCRTFWVSERNKYFDWYKDNPYYKILKEEVRE